MITKQKKENLSIADFIGPLVFIALLVSWGVYKKKPTRNIVFLGAVGAFLSLPGAFYSWEYK